MGPSCEWRSQSWPPSATFLLLVRAQALFHKHLLKTFRDRAVRAPTFGVAPDARAMRPSSRASATRVARATVPATTTTHPRWTWTRCERRGTGVERGIGVHRGVDVDVARERVRASAHGRARRGVAASRRRGVAPRSRFSGSPRRAPATRRVGDPRRARGDGPRPARPSRRANAMKYAMGLKKVLVQYAISNDTAVRLLDAVRLVDETTKKPYHRQTGRGIDDLRTVNAASRKNNNPPPLEGPKRVADTRRDGERGLARGPFRRATLFRDRHSATHANASRGRVDARSRTRCVLPRVDSAGSRDRAASHPALDRSNLKIDPPRDPFADPRDASLVGARGRIPRRSTL